MKLHSFFLTAILFVGTSIYADSIPKSVSWISSTEQKIWDHKGDVPITDWDNDEALYISIDETSTHQEIEGWGGAINEHGWVAMSVLSEDDRNGVIKAIFDTSECALNIGRISMGANDFSVTFYSCSETPDDFQMNDFSLEKDKVNIIPFALAAKAVNPNILFWGSPHSPPAWMKQNNSMVDGSLKTDEATLKAYALYFQKWVEGMDAEGISIYAVHVQNEPNISGNGYPACLMSGAEMATLIKDYIGPQFRNNNLSTEIWVGTLHSAGPDFEDFSPEYITPTLGDAQIRPLVSGVGMQWNALYFMDNFRENYPEIPTMQTETQCGNFHWMPEYNAENAPNDWGYGVFTFHRMIQWLRAGINSYCQWNIVLDETGKSNSLVKQWAQNSMITVNQTTKEIRYNPQFYAVKHFSRFVKPGARRIATTGNYSTGGTNLISPNTGEKVTDGDMIAFRNPNGDKVLLARNTSPEDKIVAVRMGSHKFKPTIPAHSLNTFLISDPVAVLNNNPHLKKTRNISIHENSGRILFTMSISTGTAYRQASLSIIDAFGKTVKVVQGQVRNNQIQFVWNVGKHFGKQAAPGAYVARITIGSNVTSTKFVHF